MKVLVVYAHHENKSFNGALKDITISELIKKGHELKVSDLYEMKFKSSADHNDFIELSNPDYFNGKSW